ncbi:MAG: hypothetical protein K2P07_11790 [Lachnospiraceae bacterium]|nr:hypothetical protein [Lachnospiraceae bacterium]
MIENSADALSCSSGAGCIGKYAGNRKTNTIQRKEIETYNRMKNLGGQPEKT